MVGRRPRRALQREALGWMLIAAASAAAMGALVHWLGRHCDWRVIAMVRAAIGVLAAYALVRLAGQRPVIRGEPALWVRSISGSLGILCTFYALASLPTADALTLMSTTPLWLVLVAAVFLRQRLAPRVVAAIVASMVGVVLIERPHLLHQNLGALAALGTSLSLAISITALTRARHVDPRAVVLHYSGAALISTSLLVAVSAEGLALRGLLDRPWVVAGLVGVGLLATASLVAATHAYRLGHPPAVASASYAKIAIAAGLDLLLWGHGASLAGLAGMALIVASSIWMIRRPESGERVSHRQVAGRSLDPDVLLTDASRASLEQAIARAEKLTSCELRVHVESGVEFPCQRRASELFERLGMEHTQLRNGLLIYLALGRSDVAFMVDDGITEVVPARALASIREALGAGIASDDPAVGIADAIEFAGATLGRYFPWRPGDMDELPNALSWGDEVA